LNHDELIGECPACHIVLYYEHPLKCPEEHDHKLGCNGRFWFMGFGLTKDACCPLNSPQNQACCITKPKEQCEFLKKHISLKVFNYLKSDHKKEINGTGTGKQKDWNPEFDK
tara:strand:- start:34 stop:369 length:336 start_codon:yes stop_codon:yes gene_type:complete